MAFRGYTNPARVSDHLGLALTGVQLVTCERLIEEVEAWIDGALNRAWLLGTRANEEHYAPPARLYLRYPPVSSLTSITGRAGLGAAETTLVAGTDYELRDAAAGLVHLVSPSSYDRVRVTYVQTSTVPADITRLATELVGIGLRPLTVGMSADVRRFRLPDLEVEYAGGINAGLPPHLQLIVDHYRYWSVA